MPHRTAPIAPSRPHPRTLALAIHLALATAVVVPATMVSPSAHAADINAAPPRQAYHLAAGPLGETLSRYAALAGMRLSFDPALVAGLRNPGLEGSYTPGEGVARLLNGSGLELVTLGNGSYTLSRSSAPVGRPSASGSGEATLSTVTVRANAEQETAFSRVRGYVAKRSATATKTDTPIIEIPQSISVVSAEFIEAIGADRMRDALAYTPGINISPWGAESRFEWFHMRGFDAISPGIYLDGMQLRNNNTWSVWRTENYATERIELMRGPSSVLFGQNGPGGMANVVSKRPLETASNEIQAQIGNNARRQLAGDFTGPLDDDGKLLYRFISVVRDAEMPAAGMPNDHVFLAPSLTWKISDATRLELYAHYLKDKTGVYSRGQPHVGSLIDNPNGKISSKAHFGDGNYDRFEQEQWMLGYRVEHRLDEHWSLRQSLRYGQMDVDYRAAYPGGFLTVNSADAADPANYRILSRTVFGSREKASSLNIDNHAEARFSFGNWQHTVLAGLDYQRSRFNQTSFWGDSGTTIDAFSGAVTGSITEPAPYADVGTRLTQSGFYIQDQAKFGERWVFTLGGRYDNAKVDADDHLANATSRQSDSKFSGRAGMVYLAPNGLAPYLSYSESFVPSTTLNPNTGKPFKPETGQQYELGLRYQPPGSKDRYSVAVFDLTRLNFVSYDSNYVPKQTGEIRVRGLEVEALVQPIENLNVVAAWSWTPEANVTKSANPDAIGKQANPVARHQVSLWADYRWPFGIKTGAGLRHIGSTRGQDEAAPAAIPAYILFDAMIGYDYGRWGIALNVRNIADKQYISQCDTSQCYYGDSRKVIGSLTYRW